MHPIIYLLLILLMALLMPQLSIAFILLSALFIFLGLNQAGRRFLFAMLQRMRWLWLSILLIMAFNTPGEVLAFWPWYIAPTYEGLTQGGIQIARLALMLLLIALMTSALKTEQLLCAFYSLSKPIRFLSLSPERLATRLWLTINYIQSHMATARHKKQGKQFLDEFLQQTKQVSQSKNSSLSQVTIPTLKFVLLDYCIISLMLLSLILAWGQY